VGAVDVGVGQQDDLVVADLLDVELFLDGIKEGSAKTVPKLDSGKSTNVTWEVAKELLSGSHQLELKRKSNGSSLSFHPFDVTP